MKGKIFNAQEVQAILNGSKVMFREVIKPQPPHDFKTTEKATEQNNGAFCIAGENYDFWFGKSPYQVGQKIFCKESFAVSDNLLQDIKYLSDNQKKFGFIGNDLADWKKRPAQHMKQEHSRLTLQIKSIGVERLGDISEEDCIKEGIPLSEEFDDRYYTPENNYAIPKIAFMRWWNATHKKPEEKFEASPWVWKISFKVVK